MTNDKRLLPVRRLAVRVLQAADAADNWWPEPILEVGHDSALLQPQDHVVLLQSVASPFLLSKPSVFCHMQTGAYR